MPQYKVLAPTWLGQRMAKAGEVIEFAGFPGATLEPLCGEGRAAAAQFEAERAARRAESAARDAESELTKHKELVANAERAKEAAVIAAREAVRAKKDADARAAKARTEAAKAAEGDKKGDAALV